MKRSQKAAQFSPLRAHDLVAPVHHRMPVIVPPIAYREWLNPDTESERMLALLRPMEWDGLQYYTVSNEVNKSGSDYPALVEPANAAMQMSLDVVDSDAGQSE